MAAMPDSDLPSRSEPDGARHENPGLPVPLPGPVVAPRENTTTWIGRLVRALFGWKEGSIRADLEVVLDAAASGETGFSPEERAMLKNILGLRERRIEDVMVPRADIVAVHQEIGLGELVKVFEGAGHSRLVVFDDTLDDPVGMVHIRDLLAFMAARAAEGEPEASTPPPTEAASESPAEPAGRRPNFPSGLDLNAIDLAVPLRSTGIIRKLLFVPPSMPAIDLLAKMQATRIHLALVIDEYGGTDGLVSIEDIVEQIVGDIEDEHDEEEAPAVVRQVDGSYLADARAHLEDVTATIGPDFDVGEIADEVDTLGGYLVVQIGRVPVRGELVRGAGGFEFEVLDADPRRVKKVRIYRAKDRSGRRDRGAKRRDGRPDGEAVSSGAAGQAAVASEPPAAVVEAAAKPASDALSPS